MTIKNLINVQYIQRVSNDVSLLIHSLYVVWKDNILCLFISQQPNDIAYVHSGYAPLSVRLAQFLERQSGWRGLEEVLRQLPGATVEERQHIPPALLKKNNAGGGGGGQTPTVDGGPQRVTLVYFLGGCTYSEISALRFLAQQENGRFICKLCYENEWQKLRHEKNLRIP